LKHKLLALGVLALLTASTGCALAQATDLDFTLTNNSTLNVAEFYTSPSSVESWGEDALGGALLPPGGTGTVTIEQGGDQCLYDMKFVFEDGVEFIDQGIDLCATGEYSLVNR
jgi:hypothetical protein